ncbi:MAG TPA: hypothetical protein PLG17_05835 [Thermodesulfobacteriota bacterium]|nr:hypothetical protein [Deltaproteobacteria bacterium]HNR13184.1 hypothetical protein [Thermodesulfobacteriota bacterium]HOC39303.1 hypothetical protein [Thermodesulfobacteriota bacterium]HQO78016.1 hypothetical protein [Thermodesulfobacteriota bacterium]
MRIAFRKYYKIVLGIVFIVLGFIGLFLPFLQGILFLAIGITLLINHSPTFQKIWLRLTSRYPRLFSLIKSKERSR